jgi:DNA repair protein RecO (recombination protein O)
MAIFLTEFLGKTLKEEAANYEMFHFLLQSILFLDQQKEHYENFTIQFLLKLARYLGFAPQQAEELMEQIGEIRIHEEIEEDKKALNELIDREYADYLHINGFVRRRILEHVLRFYQLHIENFGELRSLPVLKEMMS